MDCLRYFREEKGIDTRLVRHIVITTQGETLIPIGAQGDILGKAIVWLDSRAAIEAKELARQFSEADVYAKTGLPGMDGYLPIAKLSNVKKRQRALYDQAHKFLLLEDFLIWQLTGEIVTEKSLISSTGYYDIADDRLWNEVLEAAGIDLALIPEVTESGRIVGKVKGEMAEALQVSPDAAVVTGAMDQTSGAVGCGNIREGVAHETTGTAMVIAATLDHPDFHDENRITLYKHAIPGKYLLIPICRTAAIIQKWFKEQFCGEEEKRALEKGVSVYDLMSGMAKESKPNSDGMIMVPYFNGSAAPEIIEGAQGMFFGLGLSTTKNDFIRSIPEGLSFMLRENLEMFDRMGIRTTSVRSLGGVSKNPFWSQVKADVTGRRIVTSPGLDSTAFGAACFAAVAAGYYKSLGEAVSVYNVLRAFDPDEENKKLYDIKYKRYQSMIGHIKNKSGGK
jgi:xylulokinase